MNNKTVAKVKKDTVGKVREMMTMLVCFVRLQSKSALALVIVPVLVFKSLTN